MESVRLENDRLNGDFEMFFYGNRSKRHFLISVVEHSAGFNPATYIKAYLIKTDANCSFKYSKFHPKF